MCGLYLSRWVDWSLPDRREATGLMQVVNELND
jgi:hypothetical protein